MKASKKTGFFGRYGFAALLAGVIFMAAGCSNSFLDNTPPELDVTSATIEYGETVTLDSLIASVQDEVSDVTVSIADVSGSNSEISDSLDAVTFYEPGTYTVTVSAIDEKENETLADATVTVVDETAPVFTTLAASYEVSYDGAITIGKDSLDIAAEDEITDTTICFAEILTESGEDAGDAYEMSSDCESVTITEPGIYQITLIAADAYDNKVEATIPVTVVDDVEPELSGLRDSFTLTEYDSEPDYLDGVKATDEIDGNLTKSITVNQKNVDYGVPGEYTIKYTVADSSGNTASEKVSVTIEDTTAPVITLSQSSITITEGDTAPKFRSIVSACDAVDGDVTSSVKVKSSDVDCNEPGTYTIVYKVTDSSGNTAKKTATVTVKENATSYSSSGSDSSSTTSGSEGTVYITNYGTKYHKSGCRYLSESKIEISLSEAKARGYEPCKVCY